MRGRRETLLSVIFPRHFGRDSDPKRFKRHPAGRFNGDAILLGFYDDGHPVSAEAGVDAVREHDRPYLYFPLSGEYEVESFHCTAFFCLFPCHS